MNLLPDIEIEAFTNYAKQYELIMNSQEDEAKIFQTIQNVNKVLELLVENKIDDMTYVLNMFVNTYSQDKKSEDNFIIKDIKDFLVFCAHKTAINLDALKTLVNEEYYDNAMAVVRIIYEILINVRAYKNNKELFENKILPVAGIDLGTHRRVGKYEIEEIKTGKIYKYEIQKYQLAERAGENYKKLYDILYKQLSEFIHIDAVAAKNIFKSNDLFDDIGECLMAGFIGMIFSLEIIMELIDFEGCDNAISKDIKYFSNILSRDFIYIIQSVKWVDYKEEYQILEQTLQEYKTDYKINLQRGFNMEVY